MLNSFILVVTCLIEMYTSLKLDLSYLMNAMCLVISNLHYMSKVMPAPGCRPLLFFPPIVCVFLGIPPD